MESVIFFDIDGTLWDEQMQIPASTAEAISRLRANGHKTFICSGRARGSIRSQRLLALGFDGVVAACGNHVDLDGQTIYENLLSEEQLRRVIPLLLDCRMPVVYEGPKEHWIDEEGFGDQNYYVRYLHHELQEDARPLHGYEPGMRVNKFSAEIYPQTDFARVKRELAGEFTRLQHDEQVVEFVPKGTSKATGIEWVCNYLGVDIADAYAVGDSVNDLDMLRAAGHGIAMGNGTAPAKEAAEYVTTDIHDNGILHAMQHYGLI